MCPNNWSTVLIAGLSIGFSFSNIAVGQDIENGATGIDRVGEPEQPVRFDGHKVVRVYPTSEDELHLIQQLSPDTWSHHLGLGGPVDFRIPPENMAALDELGTEYEILIDDLQVLIDAEREGELEPADDEWFNDYKQYNEVVTYLTELTNLRPDLAEMINLGDSIHGRDIWAIHITGGDSNPTKPGILINGCQHAREWITVMSTMYLVDTLINEYDTDPRIQNYVDAYDWYIIPIVNPDGYTYTWSNNRMWRKNRRESYGVDLNRNWAFHWGGPGSSSTKSSEIYRGEKWFSEPETEAVSNFIINHPHILAHVDVHSYSQLVLQPWGWTRDLPEHHDTFDRIGQDMIDVMAGLYGTSWRHGPIYTTIYPASGGSNDWTYGARQMWGFAFELRDKGQYGFLLPKSQIIPASEECIEGIFVLADETLEPLMVFDNSWLQRGDPAELRASRCTPGADVYFFYSLKGDGETYFSELDVTLDLELPVLIDIQTANEEGIAVYTTTIPHLSKLYAVWLQAAEYGRKTNLILTQIN